MQKETSKCQVGQQTMRMNIGMIVGESFFKNTSFYIANLIIKQAIGRQNTVFIFNRTTSQLHIAGTTEITVGKFFYGQRINSLCKKNLIERLLVFEAKDIANNALAKIIFVNPNPGEQGLYEKLNCGSRVITFLEKQKPTKATQQMDERVFVTEPVVEKGFWSLNYDEKLAAKEKFAEGKVYFVYNDFQNDKDKFVEVLKAFSAFKKMQQSSWELLVLLRNTIAGSKKEEMLQPLSSFKFREDITVLEGLDTGTLAKIIGGAYALISNTKNIIYDPSVFEALLCNVPVIATSNDINEKYSQAILQTTSSAPEQIAEKMMVLYKDENLRSRISEKAGEIMKGFDAEQNISELTNLIINN